VNQIKLVKASSKSKKKLESIIVNSKSNQQLSSISSMYTDIEKSEIYESLGITQFFNGNYSEAIDNLKASIQPQYLRLKSNKRICYVKLLIGILYFRAADLNSADEYFSSVAEISRPIIFKANAPVMKINNTISSNSNNKASGAAASTQYNNKDDEGNEINRKAELKRIRSFTEYLSIALCNQSMIKMKQFNLKDAIILSKEAIIHARSIYAVNSFEFLQYIRIVISYYIRSEDYMKANEMIEEYDLSYKEKVVLTWYQVRSVRPVKRNEYFVGLS